MLPGPLISERAIAGMTAPPTASTASTGPALASITGGGGGGATGSTRIISSIKVGGVSTGSNLMTMDGASISGT